MEDYRYSERSLVEIIHLLFKGVLLFPIFLFAIYIGATMMKHMIFHGLPLMNQPSEKQIEQIKNRDQGVTPDSTLALPIPEQLEEGYLESVPELITPDAKKVEQPKPQPMKVSKSTEAQPRQEVFDTVVHDYTGLERGDAENYVPNAKNHWNREPTPECPVGWVRDGC